MTYMRNLKPAIYADCVSHYIGAAGSSPLTLVTGTLDSASNILDLFDSRPRKRALFDSDASSTDIVIKVDWTAASLYGINSLCLLNHNLFSSGAVVTVKHSSADNYALATGAVLTSQVGTYSSGAFTADGSDVIQLSSQSTLRYMWITIAPDDASFTDDIQIGQIMLARKWTAPHGPDMGGSRGVHFDGVEVTETRGGGRNAVAAWSTGGDYDSLPYGVPFRNTALTSKVQRMAGRRSWEYTLSLLDDDDVLPTDYGSSIGTGTATLSAILSLLGGQRRPCVFTPDSTSTTAGDYLWARLAQSEVVPEENSSHVLSVSLSIEEEF